MDKKLKLVSDNKRDVFYNPLNGMKMSKQDGCRYWKVIDLIASDDKSLKFFGTEDGAIKFLNRYQRAISASQFQRLIIEKKIDSKNPFLPAALESHGLISRQ